MTPAEVIFLLCAVASLACAVVLVRGYYKTKTRLLLWSSLCFAGLAMNNFFLFVDFVMVPEMELWGSLWRTVISTGSGLILLYGLIWELT